MKRILFIFSLMVLCFCIIGFIGCEDNSGYDNYNNSTDTVDPTVSISNLPDNSIVKTGFVTGTASDNAGIRSVEVSLDGGAYTYASGTDNWTYALPSGSSTWADCSEHIISVRSNDAAGNVSDITTITVIKGINSDFNGDGYSDVVVGALYYDNGQYNEGMAFVYHGSSSGLNTTADWTAESDQDSAELGRSVSSAGDVNSDGYDDVVAGAPYYDNGLLHEGMAFVYHGSSSGLNATADWTAESNQDNAYFGFSVSD
jgi:hypothetical protein